MKRSWPSTGVREGCFLAVAQREVDDAVEWYNEQRDGDELFDDYLHLLEKLGNEKGLLGLIFNKSQNKFQDPAKLRRLIVDLIDKENWSVMSADG